MRACLTVLFLLSPLLARSQQANVNLDYKPERNTFAAFTAMPPHSQLVVQGDGPACYEARNVPHGKVTRHVHHPNVTTGERELHAYTPPGYHRTNTYPVLYLVGGSGELPSNRTLHLFLPNLWRKN